MRELMPGLFISFEGGEGSGKTTQLKALLAHLRSACRDVIETRDPGGTPIGKQIRGLLLDRQNAGMAPAAELLLYEASRAQVIHEVIRPALSQGRIVLCDRFTDSTVAYQGVLLSEIMGKENAFSFLDEMWEFFLRPDATILFVSDPVKAIHRVGTRGPRTSYERMEFLALVQEAFVAMEAKEPDRFVRVYADVPLETLIKEVETKVKHALTK